MGVWGCWGFVVGFLVFVFSCNLILVQLGITATTV